MPRHGVRPSPEAKARENIDKQLTACGWIVQARKQANVAAGSGAAIGEFPLKSGYGEADYYCTWMASPPE